MGWLNAGATIVVKGDGGDTTGHAAADGLIYIGGRVGTRSGSMMKHDPAYPAPELWVLKNTGSFSFEFMGGGIAVVCGFDCESLASVIGDRACVGMVGGTVYVRGPVGRLPGNVRLVEELDGEDRDFILDGMPKFLKAIERPDLFEELSNLEDWHKILARPQSEAKLSRRVSMQDFRLNQWIAGGLFGDVIEDTGRGYGAGYDRADRAYSPVWNNAVFMRPASRPARSASPPKIASTCCARASCARRWILSGSTSPSPLRSAAQPAPTPA